MSDLLWQGLMISITGMGLTFVALGLLVGVMTLLERYTRDTPSPISNLERKDMIREVTQANNEEAEIAAAIAVALAHFRAIDIGRSSLGARLVSGPGAWRTRQWTSQPIPITPRKDDV